MTTIPIHDVELTPEQEALRIEWESTKYEREVAEVAELRQSAYQRESDPLNFKWQISGLDEDKVAWLAKREEIKARYPDPTPPKPSK